MDVIAEDINVNSMEAEDTKQEKPDLEEAVLPSEYATSPPRPSDIQSDILCQPDEMESSALKPQYDSDTIVSPIRKLEISDDGSTTDEKKTKNSNEENSAQNGIKMEIENIITHDYGFDNIKLIASSNDYFTPNQYLVGCKWSPDGSCLLTNCADCRLRLFDLPNHLYTMQELETDEVTCLKPSLTVADGGLIYDYDWYPHMSSWSPLTCCFLSSSSETPVHLFDAFTGDIRASYNGLNYAEEITNAYSVKFSLSGDKIYCGYTNFLKIFDTAIPGSKCTTLNLKHLNDQRGMVSCIAQNPAITNLFAAGTYRSTIGLYTDEKDAICLMKGQKGGVTHLMYSTDGTKLYSGGRNDEEILCWDLRNPGDVLYVIKRTVKTNQRIYFDMTADGRFLMTGGTDGKVTFYDITNESTIENEKQLDELCHFTPHLDCTNGVSFNRRLPVIATTSGKRSYVDIVSDEEDEEMFHKVKDLKNIENTVKLWWIGRVKPSEI
ncbi:telomerase Cajal body protein 1 isoform X2 [Cimex lectularius]|nr:telomerase Cajal body protein 1 isoform X2 [Cimex lectularius]